METNEMIQNSSSKREVESRFFQKYDFVLGISLALTLTVGMMLVYFIEGTIHLNILREVNHLFNQTARFDQILLVSENFQR